MSTQNEVTGGTDEGGLFFGWNSHELRCNRVMAKEWNFLLAAIDAWGENDLSPLYARGERSKGMSKMTRGQVFELIGFWVDSSIEKK